MTFYIIWVLLHLLRLVLWTRQFFKVNVPLAFEKVHQLVYSSILLFLDGLFWKCQPDQLCYCSSLLYSYLRPVHLFSNWELVIKTPLYSCGFIYFFLAFTSCLWCSVSRAFRIIVSFRRNDSFIILNSHIYS